MSTVSPVSRGFHFDLLPVEVQDLVVSYAVEQARGFFPERKGQRICDLLCVSPRMYDLAVPHLYKRVTLSSNRESISLIAALHFRPERMQPIRKLELRSEHGVDPAVQMLLRMIKRGDDQEDHGFKGFRRLYISTSDLYGLSLAVRMLTEFDPMQLEWKCELPPAQERLYLWPASSRSSSQELADAVGEASVRGALADVLVWSAGLAHSIPIWLDRLVVLHLDGIHGGETSAKFLASLPHLKSLSLRLTTRSMQHLSSASLVTLFTTGQTRTTLTALTICGLSLPDRRSIQQELGVCILKTKFTACVSDPIPTCVEQHISQEGIRHGCRATIKGRDRAHHPCPRCCQLGGHPEPSEAPQSSESPSSSMTFHYGLCDMHYDEIFGSSVAGNDTHGTETSFLHRRVLECVRWHSCEEMNKLDEAVIWSRLTCRRKRKGEDRDEDKSEDEDEEQDDESMERTSVRSV